MNRLADARSPYLRQHAGNPVDWYPWGEEALARAAAEDKPLFVSIGYAACHWCHVMAHESFSDPTVADDLARGFVSVKVDREERPDVDAVYMAAVQAMTGAGGWPMSVFCTPDGRPFLAGTYFPPVGRPGMPSFRGVLGAVATAWKERRGDVDAQAEALAQAVERDATFVDRLAAAAPATSSKDARGAGAIGAVVDELRPRFDAARGGFGPAPKFPRPALVELCLRHHLRSGDERSREMAITTLDAMAAGGIYDHVEGGFARYSTDATWLVPHFEKMLTDQALLTRTYIRAWQVTGAAHYLQVATETIDYVCEAMQTVDGGLCSSVDADSAGVEGAHATWTPSEVHEALVHAGTEHASHVAKVLCEWYGITEEGNWEHGRSVPCRPRGASLERPTDIEQGRRAMLAARRARPQPARDDKVITEWNAMFAAALAEAAAASGAESWRARAEVIASSLFDHHRREDGRWLRVAGSGIPAFAGDHGWLVECCTRLAELTGQAVWTERAEGVAAALLDLFVDERNGGVFTAGSDAEHLVVRAKEVVDGALPSANAVAAQSLLRLGMLTGERRWTQAGERIVSLTAPLLHDQPLAVTDMVAATTLAEEGAEVMVTGDRPDLLREARRHWLPDAVVAWGEAAQSPFWEGRELGAAHVCRQFVCDEPVTDVASFEPRLLALVRGTAG